MEKVLLEIVSVTLLSKHLSNLIESCSMEGFALNILDSALQEGILGLDFVFLLKLFNILFVSRGEPDLGDVLDHPSHEVRINSADIWVLVRMLLQNQIQNIG